MSNGNFLKRTSYLMAAAATAPLLSLVSGHGAIAFAQTGDISSDDSSDDTTGRTTRVLGTVYVEARRTEESLQEVPVVVQAFDAELLESLAATRLDDIGSITSGLTVSTNALTNPFINIRGLRTDPVNFQADGTIAINFDGIAHSNANILRLSMFDAEAVEVLKGPQALYFGKNSPGGIIAIRTKDPTDELFTQLQVGYEFAGELKYAHGIVSGPLSDNWGGRLAARVASQEGYFENVWGDGDPTATQPVEPKGPKFDEYQVFGTLLGEFEKTTITAKVAHMNLEGGGQGFSEAIFCNSVQDNNPFEDCKINGKVANEDFSGLPGSPSLANRDRPTSEFDLTQLSLNIDHRLNENWSVNSITGLYDSSYFYVNNSGQRPAPPSPSALAFSLDGSVELFSQEVRLAGSFDRFNIAVGAQYDDRTLDTIGVVWIAVPIKLTPDVAINYNTASWSAFAQADFDLTDKINVSAGGRYTESEVDYSGRNLDSGLIGIAGPVLTDPNTAKFDNFSPEVTISYQPQDNLNFFASYREGFKSGGFGAAELELAPTTLTGVPVNELYQEELVKGFELGAKTELFNNTLRLNTALYSYDFDNLQVGEVVRNQGGVGVVTTNAGGATVEGVEIDLQWVTPVEGLDVNLNMAYNESRYVRYISECNDYQIYYDPSGCDVDLDNNIATDAGGGRGPLAGTGFDAQNRAGDPLQNAPDWSGSAGFSYQRGLTDNLLLNATGLVVYSDEYHADGVGDARAVQGSYFQLNSSIGISAADGKWDLELIGRNLTDELYALSMFAADPGAGLLDESPNIGFIPSTPRQIFVQFTYRPQGL